MNESIELKLQRSKWRIERKEESEDGNELMRVDLVDPGNTVFLQAIMIEYLSI